jgi:hypothetical protein
MSYGKPRSKSEAGKEELTHQEWLDTGWIAAKAAILEALELMREHEIKRLKVGRPFDIEIELS